MKKDAEMNAEADAKLKEDAETVNQADSTIFNIEKTMKDLDEKLTEEQKTEINGLVTELKESLKEKDIENIKTKTMNLNLAFQNISQELYSKSTEGQTDSEVSDVDFEEVKQN